MTLQNRQIVKHLRTTGTTAPSPQVLKEGEVALAMDNNDPKIFFKKNNGQMAEFVDEGYLHENIIGKQDKIEDGDGLEFSGDTLNMIYATREDIDALFDE